MAATHNSGPVYAGPSAPIGEVSAQGGVVLTQKYDLADVTAVTGGVGFDAFRLPVNAEILDMSVLVVTASNAVTTATLKLTDGTNDIVTGANLKSVANSLLSVKGGGASIASAALVMARASGSDETLQLVYAETGGAATAGRAVVYLTYIQKA